MVGLDQDHEGREVDVVDVGGLDGAESVVDSLLQGGEAVGLEGGYQGHCVEKGAICAAPVCIPPLLCCEFRIR